MRDSNVIGSLQRCLPPPVKRCLALPPPRSLQISQSAITKAQSPASSRKVAPVYPGLTTLWFCALVLGCVATGCGYAVVLHLRESSVVSPTLMLSVIAFLLALHGAWLTLVLSRSASFKAKVTAKADQSAHPFEMALPDLCAIKPCFRRPTTNSLANPFSFDGQLREKNNKNVTGSTAAESRHLKTEAAEVSSCDRSCWVNHMS